MGRIQQASASEIYKEMGSRLADSSDSLGLLYSLHGRSGTFSSTERPAWVEALEEEEAVQIDWAEARVRLSDGRVMKLGKWLRKVMVADEALQFLLHLVETREVLRLDWVIKADPESVLAMSHGRGWTSCLRPGGTYEYGPLSEVKAGAAVVYFFRPGADEPCGRELLRPGIYQDKGEWKPCIHRAGVVYGTGTSVPDEDISPLLPCNYGGGMLFGDGTSYVDDNDEDRWVFSEDEDLFLWVFRGHLRDINWYREDGWCACHTTMERVSGGCRQTRCAVCGKLISSERVREWKNLPSSINRELRKARVRNRQEAYRSLLARYGYEVVATAANLFKWMFQPVETLGRREDWLDVDNTQIPEEFWALTSKSPKEEWKLANRFGFVHSWWEKVVSAERSIDWRAEKPGQGL